MADPSLGIGGSDDVAHVIQVALTPVFLLSGIGTLLGMFNLRQNRISDHMITLSDLAAKAEEPARRERLERRVLRMQRRRTVLDAALILGALGAAATCGAALVLFLGSVRDAQVATWLNAMFGAALGCTVLALVAFLGDTMLAWHGLRVEGPMPLAGKPPS